MSTSSELDSLFQITMRQIKEAADTGNLGALTLLTKKAEELEQLKRAAAGIETRLKLLAETIAPKVDSAPIPSRSQNGALRVLPVEVTDGMIRQNLLTLTPHVKQGKIQTGEILRIETQPGGHRFGTELLSAGNRLQERAAIKRFYAEVNMKDGEFAVLTETAPRQWTLRKATPGEYRGRRALLESL